jgi:multicomponent Na+:H+ antiporter subunit A
VAATALAVAATAVIAAVHQRGEAGFDVSWIPSLGARLSLRLDDLAALYALLAAGVGIPVFLYATAYLPLHLAHADRSRRDERRFFALMGLFLVAMAGLATAQDLWVLFVFWDITAIASYGLIGFDRDRAEARSSALMALLITGVSAVLLLVGILIVRNATGTSSIPEALAAARAGEIPAAAGALIAVAALAKSAQVPLHFWLPRAMAAPTPVSAYLHSAAMVAAGVFLLSRLHPLLAAHPVLLDALIAVGLASMAVGGVLALAGTQLKQVLAHSTIAQYGYVVVLLGVGGPAGAGAACFYVLAHALAKSALFLTAGAVTEATGAKDLRETGGLARRMPLLAAGSAAAAAGLAALPLTAGFFKDELLFKAAAERGTWLAVAVVAMAALTLAYTARFWGELFLGAPRQDPRPLPRRLVLPVAALGALVVAGGIVVEPVTALAAGAAGDVVGTPVELATAYHLDLRTENVMALATYAAGALILAGRSLLAPGLLLARRVGEAAGPERAYHAGLHALDRVSDAIHAVEVRDLRARLRAVLVPAAALVAVGVLVTPTDGAYKVGQASGRDLPLIVALLVVGIAAVAAARPRRHAAFALSLSAVGLSLAVAYALVGAPDVALVAVLVETLLALLFLGVFALLPREVLAREAALPEPRSRRVRDALVATASGLVALLVAWGALSRPTPTDGMAERHLELADEAHGKDVVTVILADFRGLDTLVEVSVVAVAVLGVLMLLRRGRA